MVLEKDGDDQLDRSCEKWRSVTWSGAGAEYLRHKKTKQDSRDRAHLLKLVC